VLDQSFSSQNLFFIFQQVNRSGNNISSKLFHEIVDSYKKIKRLRGIISKLYSKKRTHTGRWFETRVSNLYLLLKHLKNERNILVTDKLNIISSNISAKNFTFGIKKSSEQYNSKSVYLIDGTAESFFAEKQIQKNIKYTYRVKQNDRDLIVPQLFACLNNKFPIQVIRTDIKGFYESIDRTLLLSKLNETAMLSLSSRKMIAKLLRSYETLSGEATGIPRGIGVSAYLSELYLKNFDKKVRELDDVVYYARYVDDIILIGASNSKGAKDAYLKSIEELLGHELLTVNTDDDKTRKYSFPEENADFDYLGYKYTKKKNSVSLSISKKKFDKYVKKLNFAVQKYNVSWMNTPKKSRAELALRLKFLTTNTRLTNNKGNAVIGIYNNNKWVTDFTFLKALDDQLQNALSKLDNPDLKVKLKGKYSFKKGFDQRIFNNFTAKEFSMIGRRWV
jgi:hypothetical protein